MPAGEQVSPGPAMRAFSARIVQAWPGVSSGGISRGRDRAAVASQYDPHRNGFACDLMLKESGQQRFEIGSGLASWLVRNAELLGLQYVLFARYEWSSSSRGARWEAYTGSDPHENHVHVELGPEARAWPAAEMARRLDQALAGGMRRGAEGDENRSNGDVLLLVAAAAIAAALVAWKRVRR